MTATLTSHPIVSRAEWLRSRKELLSREKELTRAHDALAEERRRFPWVRVDEPYVFTSESGTESLADLFAGRSQLAIYHFMFGPDWEEGCPTCSAVTDHLDRTAVHLAARDVTLILASRAPFEKLQAFRARMGWKIKWVSTAGSTFNPDFGVSFPADDLEQKRRTYNYGSAVPFNTETGGLSIFARDESGGVFHTYSTYGRGAEFLILPYPILDLTPKGRDEAALPWTTAWIKHHDRY
jgi:predicted dithiol-disulfide oxidoreductase (DUF899 family)